MKKFVLSLAILLVSATPVLADWIYAPAVFVPIYYADQNSDVRAETGYDEAKLSAHCRMLDVVGLLRKVERDKPCCLPQHRSLPLIAGAGSPHLLRAGKLVLRGPREETGGMLARSEKEPHAIEHHQFYPLPRLFYAIHEAGVVEELIG